MHPKDKMDHKDSLEGSKLPINEDFSGQRVLNLVRSVEKRLPSSVSTDQASLDDYQELCGLLKQLIYQIRSYGILMGDEEEAARVVATSSDPSAKGHPQKKIKTQESGSLSDTALLMSALIRLLEGEDWLLMALAADVCEAACDHARTTINCSDHVLTFAEREILNASGKQLLSSLERAACRLESERSNDDEDCRVLSLCLRAMSAILVHLGTRLSRSNPLLSKMADVAWKCCDISQTSRAASKLLATLPAAGSSNGRQVSEFLNASVSDALYALSSLLITVTPVTSTSTLKSVRDRQVAGECSKRKLRYVVEQMKSMDAMEDRATLFLQFTQFLVCYVSDLLALDGYKVYDVLDVSVDLDAVLAIVDYMLSFTVSCEARYLLTKKRLRVETLEKGLVSPDIAVTSIAIPLTTLGHRLLDTLLDVLPDSLLVCQQQRLFRMIHGGLLSSCSEPVRRTIDILAHGKSKRRLQSLYESLQTRALAMSSFQSTIVALGVGPKSTKDAPEVQADENVESMVALVCASLVEQCWPICALSCGHGSFETKIYLQEQALGALEACIISGGEFLSIRTRKLIESTAVSMLTLLKSNTEPIQSYSRVNRALSSLLRQCVCTPWSDGSSSPLTLDFGDMANVSTADPRLRETSQSARKLSGLICMPRSPPLVVPSGGYEEKRFLEDPSALLRRLFEESRLMEKERGEREKKIESKNGKEVTNSSNRAPEEVAPIQRRAPSTSKTTTDGSNKPIEDATTILTPKDSLSSPKPAPVPTAALPMADGDNGDDEESGDEDFPLIIADGPDADDA